MWCTFSLVSWEMIITTGKYKTVHEYCNIVIDRIRCLIQRRCMYHIQQYIWYPNLLSHRWKRSFRYIYVASSSSMTYPTLGGSVWSGTERVITLKRLNCLKDFERCIYISNHILDFVQQVRANAQCNNLTCCLSYTRNTMPADALAT